MRHRHFQVHTENPERRGADGRVRPSGFSPGGWRWSTHGRCSICLRWFILWLALAAGSSGLAADAEPALPQAVQRSLEREDWAGVLRAVASDPLDHPIARLAVVRALFETGRLPEEQFAWIHRPGPELLSTAELKRHAGSVHIAETLLQLGHVNAAERLAFDSLEMEGESAAVLRTLARLHAAKGLPVAAAVFLNRLQAYPEHRAWALGLRTALATNAPATADPSLARLGTNLVTADRIAAGLTTERLLRHALEANPRNRMAFQFLMAHQLQARQLPGARVTLAASPLVRDGALPRHYAEAMVLHRQLHPGISLGALAERIPADTSSRYLTFQEMMKRNQGSPERAQAEAWRDYGRTYWYYHFFGASHPSHSPANPSPP